MTSDSDNKNPEKSGAPGARGLATVPADDRFLTVWEKEMEFKKEEMSMRREEISLRGDDLKHQKDFAMASLEADTKKHTEMLNVGGKESTKQKLFIGAVIVAVMGFIVALVMQDNARLAETVVSLAGGGVLGAFGGYGYAMQKSGRERERFND